MYIWAILIGCFNVNFNKKAFIFCLFLLFFVLFFNQFNSKYSWMINCDYTWLFFRVPQLFSLKNAFSKSILLFFSWLQGTVRLIFFRKISLCLFEEIGYWMNEHWTVINWHPESAKQGSSTIEHILAKACEIIKFKALVGVKFFSQSTLQTFFLHEHCI